MGHTFILVGHGGRALALRAALAMAMAIQINLELIVELIDDSPKISHHPRVTSSINGLFAMKKLFATLTSVFLLSVATSALAADDYNKVPAGDKQYAACISYSNKNYEGGNESSPVKGQTKAQAFCTCMWNETPDDFKGSLAKFAETSKGKSINRICEKHSDWGNE